MSTREGQQLGNYFLLRLLGSGGFADVYLGEHIHLKSQAAIKVLLTRLVEEHLQMFRTEAQMIARLKHPHIVPILDFDVKEGTAFIVMEYAPHGSLREYHPKETQLPLETIISYVKQVAAALQYAHDTKLIHRDVKPENMLLGHHHEVLLSDFGLVLVAQSSGSQTTKEMAGTIPYMAPEQLRGKPRPASDQYALGVVVYEWLCGARPFQGSFIEVAAQHLTMPPPPLRKKLPTISPVLENVVLQALEKEPQKRFPSVQAFAEALEQAGQIAEHNTLSLPIVTRSLDQSSESIHEKDLSTYVKPTSMQSTPFTDEKDLSTYVKTAPLPSTQPPYVAAPSNQPSQTGARNVTANILEVQGKRGVDSVAISGKPPRSSKSHRNPLFALITLSIVFLLLAMAGLFFFEFQAAAMVSASINFSPQVHSIRQVFHIKGSPAQSRVDVNTGTIPVKTLTGSKTGSQAGDTSQQCISPGFGCQNIVTSDDVDRIAGQLKQSLDSQVSQNVKSQLQALGADQVGSIVFTTTSATSDPPVGSESKTVIVTMTEEGQVAYFLNHDAQELARLLLNQQAQKLGPNYLLLSSYTRVGQPVVDGVDNSGLVSIKIAAGAVTQYQFSSAQLSGIKNAIRGKKIKDAISYIKQQPGVDANAVAIHVTVGNSMPGDIQHMRIITIKPANYPPVQLPVV